MSGNTLVLKPLSPSLPQAQSDASSLEQVSDVMCEVPEGPCSTNTSSDILPSMSPPLLPTGSLCKCRGREGDT